MLNFFKKNKPRIMLVEDDEFDHNMLRDYLSASDFDVISVRDARQTQELIRQTKPQAIFMALMLNDLISGDELVEKLKAEPEFNIPVVGMSSQVNTDSEYFYSVCDYQLAKPLTIANISNITTKLFG